MPSHPVCVFPAEMPSVILFRFPSSPCRSRAGTHDNLKRPSPMDRIPGADELYIGEYVDARRLILCLFAHSAPRLISFLGACSLSVIISALLIPHVPACILPYHALPYAALRCLTLCRLLPLSITSLPPRFPQHLPNFTNMETNPSTTP